MRISLVLAFLFSLSSYAQDFQMNNKEIESKIHGIRQNSILVDSLTYIDSTCTYFYDYTNTPFDGYAIYRFENKVRFNLFKDGKYTGEEWIFNNTHIFNYDSLVNNLQEFRVVCDTNSDFTVVTTYYDFYTNKVQEYYIAKRELCVEINSLKPQPFENIFGGDTPEFSYYSFYENGNKKVVSYRKKSFCLEETYMYFENGSIESYKKIIDYENEFSKRFNEEGKCIYRLKIKNKKVRGGYAISNGKTIPSFLIRLFPKKYLGKKRR